MVQITLNQEESERLRSEGTLEVRDANGILVAKIDWEDTPEFLDEMKRRREESRGKPKVPGTQVLGHLDELEREWDRKGGFDAAYAVEFVRELRAKERQ